MSNNHSLILELIDEGTIDPKVFLESLLSAMGEHDITENLEYIARVEDWPRSIQNRIKE